MVAVRGGGRSAVPGAIAGPQPAPAVPPPPPPFRSELDELAALEELELEAGGQESGEVFEDIFGHMESDMGAAPKRACRRSEAEAAELQSGVVPARPHQHVQDAPPAKRARAASEKAPPQQAVETVVPASLEGLELRLLQAGEDPRFRPSEAGGLVHHCASYRALVRFWPNALAWCVEGLDGGIVEAVLAAPLHPV